MSNSKRRYYKITYCADEDDPTAIKKQKGVMETVYKASELSVLATADFEAVTSDTHSMFSVRHHRHFSLEGVKRAIEEAGGAPFHIEWDEEVPRVQEVEPFSTRKPHIVLERRESSSSPPSSSSSSSSSSTSGDEEEEEDYSEDGSQAEEDGEAEEDEEDSEAQVCWKCGYEHSASGACFGADEENEEEEEEEEEEVSRGDEEAEEVSEEAFEEE